MKCGKIHHYGFAAILGGLFSCGIFQGEQPPRQYVAQGRIQVLLQNDLQLFKNGTPVFKYSLRPDMPVIAGIRKDTVFLTYFMEKGGRPEEKYVDAGDSLWLKWKTVPLRELIPGNAIAATAFSIKNNRLEVQPTGSAVKLSFAMNNIVYDKTRILAFTHSPYKSTYREITLPADLQHDFERQFAAYAGHTP